MVENLVDRAISFKQSVQINQTAQALNKLGRKLNFNQLEDFERKALQYFAQFLATMVKVNVNSRTREEQFSSYESTRLRPYLLRALMREKVMVYGSLLQRTYDFISQKKKPKYELHADDVLRMERVTQNMSKTILNELGAGQGTI